MSDDEDTRSHVVTEVHPGATLVRVQTGIDYTDGAHVTVGWHEQDQTWYARCGGIEHVNELGHGDTAQEAMLCLITSMACTINALHQWNREDRKTPKKTPRTGTRRNATARTTPTAKTKTKASIEDRLIASARQALEMSRSRRDTK